MSLRREMFLKTKYTRLGKYAIETWVGKFGHASLKKQTCASI